MAAKSEMTLKIVTDSACDIPDELVDVFNITVVPVYINIGEDSYLDGTELPRQEFFNNLNTYHPYPRTSAPAVGAFAETYARLAHEGATEILSIHIAASLSNTWNAARLGADAVSTIPVTVFDTKQVSLGSALLVITAAEMAARGCTLAEITSFLAAHLSNTRLFGMLNTLDSLRRSGRVNWAEFGIGTLLQIKPVMMISDGAISVLAKVRTRNRAIQYMLDQVSRYGPFEKFAVAHVNAPEAAAKLKKMAMSAFPNVDSLPIMSIGPAVGTHLGLDAVGFACIGTAS